MKRQRPRHTNHGLLCNTSAKNFPDFDGNKAIEAFYPWVFLFPLSITNLLTIFQPRDIFRQNIFCPLFLASNQALVGEPSFSVTNELSGWKQNNCRPLRYLPRESCRVDVVVMGKNQCDAQITVPAMDPSRSHQMSDFPPTRGSQVKRPVNQV